ncbi:hypothetical protein [Nocardia gipuzkoensis]|uniref:hypothetical protein n=1 Tax=Nocardia gipuzkoensis TaxID=2749991 RepID=UPI00237EBB58|nr:hypothetical protein [Nocardia gipuzkoensis]MDE1673187.1 hypothetical protein [Nocardia gipuzkoensis]
MSDQRHDRTFRSWILAVRIMAVATDNHHTRVVEAKADQAGSSDTRVQQHPVRKELSKAMHANMLG